MFLALPGGFYFVFLGAGNKKMELASRLAGLSLSLKGELLTDEISRDIYSTDASVYKEKQIGRAHV